MNEFIRQFRDLRHIAPYVIAVRIEFLALGHRVEDPEIRCRIGTATGNPLPARAVVGEIGIEQCVPEPALTVMPVQHQVFDQE